MSLILKNAVKQVDEKSKSYFVDKLKEYDYLIDEKEKKLSELESDEEHQTVTAAEKTEWSSKISSQQNVEDADKIFTIDIDGKVILKTLTEVNSGLTWGMLAGKS